MRLAVPLLLVLQLLGTSASAASDRYDRRLRFHTISTPRFDVHFHQGEEAEARRLAAIAESVAAELDVTLGTPSGRVQVILVDQSDLSNGWATPLPYNTIEITAATPRGTSAIGNTTDWLRMVFAHEYTHIVHLSRGKGWIGGLRRVFGRMPLLYPNLFVPVWQIEGIATYEESALTGEGRVRDGSFRTILDVATAQRTFEPLDRVGGGLVDWPGGDAPYLYGSYFHQFLRDRYGEQTLRQLTDATAGRLPYLGSGAFRKVYGRSLAELWEDFESTVAAAPPGFAPSVTRLTRHGFTVREPRFGPDGRIYYSIVNPHGFPSLASVDGGGGRPERIANRFLGDSVAPAASSVVFDQIEVENQVGLQSDLYSVSMHGGAPTRLTNGARAADPDVSPDGRTIACTVQRADRRDIAVLDVPALGRTGAPSPLISEAHVHFASPRWSPDGRWIAAERGPSAIVLIDPASKQIVATVAATGTGRIVTPAFMSDGTLLFASDAGGRGFQLYRTDLKTLETRRLEGTGPDARSPDVSPDGRSMVFVGYTVEGYDLFSVPLSAAKWTSVAPELFERKMRAPQAMAASTVSSAPPVPYAPWRTLAPRFWIPLVASEGDELSVGAATGSADALGRHVYGASAAWSRSRATPDWLVTYAYDRWRPTLFANASDDTDAWRDGDIRTREVNAGAQLPFRRIRWSQWVLGALHSSTERLRCTGCDTEDVARRAVRGGWRVNASRGYGYSVSLEEGWSAAVSTELTREALGADGDAGAMTFDVRGYLPVAPRHGAVAVRAAGAATWGDTQARRFFSASGSAPQPGGFRFESDAIGLLRGVEEDELVGRHAAVLNLDYRFPLKRLDRGSGTLPVFARVVHGAVFADAGSAWNGRFRLEDAIVSAGAEASLDLVLGHSVPITFATGVAWVSNGRGVSVFGRIGRAF
jgi:Tol biopolymer transport system component